MGLMSFYIYNLRKNRDERRSRCVLIFLYTRQVRNLGQVISGYLASSRSWFFLARSFNIFT